MIGRDTWYDRGALALRRDGSGFVIESDAAEEFRPAMGAGAAAAPKRSATSTDGDALRRRTHSPPRDATPPQDDIEADQ